MFQIRAEHLHAFTVMRRLDFEERLLAHLTAELPEVVAALEMPALQQRIRTATERALGYGVRDEDDVADYVRLSLELGDRFEFTPAFTWAATILHDATRDGEDKIASLLEGVDQLSDPGEADADEAAAMDILLDA